MTTWPDVSKLPSPLVFNTINILQLLARLKLNTTANQATSLLKDRVCVTSMPVEHRATQVLRSILLHRQEELETGLTTRAGLAYGSLADLQRQV